MRLGLTGAPKAIEAVVGRRMSRRISRAACAYRRRDGLNSFQINGERERQQFVAASVVGRVPVVLGSALALGKSKLLTLAFPGKTVVR